MKSNLALASLLSLLLWGCGDGEPEGASFDSRALAKVVVMPNPGVEQSRLDTLQLGRLHDGESVETGYWLKNSDSKPLVIVSSVTGCGCTTIGYDAKPIAPNDSTFIKVIYDSKNKFGQQIQDIDLISSDNRIAKTILMVEVVDNN